MDGLLTEASIRANLVSQHCLPVSDSGSSPPVPPQQGILGDGANTLEPLERNSKTLNIFDIHPSEARSILFQNEQKMISDDSLSKGATTASDRCPSLPSSVGRIDPPSGSSAFIKNKKTGEFLVNNGSDATDIHSYSYVKLTCKNAIIECLQHDKNLHINEIFIMLSERFPGKKGKVKYSLRTIQSTLSLHKNTFSFVHDKSGGFPNNKTGYWFLKEDKVNAMNAMNAMNDSVALGSIDNNPVFSKDPEVPDCKNKTLTKIFEVQGYKNEIIECLLHKGNMSVNEISEDITMRRKSRNINDKVNRRSIRNVLGLHREIFKNTPRIYDFINKKNVLWFMEESTKNKFLSSKELYSIAPINFIDTPPVLPKHFKLPICKKKIFVTTLKMPRCENDIIECLRYREEMSTKEICAHINRLRQSRKLKRGISERNVVNVLVSKPEIFKCTEIREGVLNTKERRWSMKESVKNQFLSSEGIDSIAPMNFMCTPPFVSDVELDTYPAMLYRSFEGGKVLTPLELYAAILKQHPDINEKRHCWKSGVRHVLQRRECFQWSKSYKGVSNARGFWRMKDSMNKSVESDEQLKFSNVAPPLPTIQPRLSLIASGAGAGASAIASQMNHSEGMVSIDHDNRLPSELLCRSEEGGSLGTQDESLTNEGLFFSQKNFLVLQQILESEMQNTRAMEEWLVEQGGGISENELCNSAKCSDTSVQKNNLELIYEDELIGCVNSREKLTHNKHDKNMEEQDSYINKNEHGYFDEHLKSESKKLVTPPFRDPSVENENKLGDKAQPDQFGCILGSPLISKGYVDVDLEKENL